MLNWKIYYNNGTTFDDTQGTPDDAYAFGVLLILQRSEDGRDRDTVMGADYYVYTDAGFWAGADLPGLIDRLVHRIPFTGFLTGRWQPRDEYSTIIQSAKADTDFPAERVRGV